MGVYSPSDITSPLFDRNLLISKNQVHQTTSSTNKSLPKEKSDKSQEKQMIDQLHANMNATTNGFRIGSRNINRYSMKQSSNGSRNNYIIKKKDDTFEVKL